MCYTMEDFGETEFEFQCEGGQGWVSGKVWGRLSLDVRMLSEIWLRKPVPGL